MPASAGLLEWARGRGTSVSFSGRVREASLRDFMGGPGIADMAPRLDSTFILKQAKVEVIGRSIRPAAALCGGSSSGRDTQSQREIKLMNFCGPSLKIYEQAPSNS
jgi:hypothetical protein